MFFRIDFWNVRKSLFWWHTMNILSLNLNRWVINFQKCRLNLWCSTITNDKYEFFSYLSLAKINDIKRCLTIFNHRNFRIKFQRTWKIIVIKLSLVIVKYRQVRTVLYTRKVSEIWLRGFHLLGKECMR